MSLFQGLNILSPAPGAFTAAFSDFYLLVFETMPVTFPNSLGHASLPGLQTIPRFSTFLPSFLLFGYFESTVFLSLVGFLKKTKHLLLRKD